MTTPDILGSTQLERDDPTLHKAYLDVQQRLRNLRETHARDYPLIVQYLSNEELTTIAATHPYVGWNPGIIEAAQQKADTGWWT